MFWISTYQMAPFWDLDEAVNSVQRAALHHQLSHIGVSEGQGLV